MALALVTVGTSFREALCWNMEGIDYSIFSESGIKPSTPEVRELRYKMGQITWDKTSGFFENKLIDINSVDGYLWRYPAEIDTFFSIESRMLDQVTNIRFIVSSTESGITSANVLKYIIEDLWPDRFTFEDNITYPELQNGRYNIDAVCRQIEEAMAASQSAFLFVTGGYKLISMIGLKAFDQLTAQGDYKLIYKHEAGKIIVHYKDASSIVDIIPL